MNKMLLPSGIKLVGTSSNLHKIQLKIFDLWPINLRFTNDLYFTMPNDLYAFVCANLSKEKKEEFQQ